MNAVKDCKKCKNLTYNEYWCRTGRSTQAYCKAHREFVRFIKDCDQKK